MTALGRRLMKAAGCGLLVTVLAGLYGWHPSVSALAGVAAFVAAGAAFDVYDRRQR